MTDEELNKALDEIQKRIKSEFGIHIIEVVEVACFNAFLAEINCVFVVKVNVFKCFVKADPSVTVGKDNCIVA